jgi:predicted dehydrogenase
VPIALDALNKGRHVCIEVPMAMSVDDCWKLVDTAERTRRHCMMLENCCYGDSEMMVLNMVRQGVLGELIHGEAGYIHNLLAEKFDLNREGAWRTAWSRKLNGNIYPTHGLGPVAQYMNINRGDRFEYLTSMSSPSRGLRAYATEKFGASDPRAADVYVCGDMNTSLIKTNRGLTVMLQHDTSSPRPYSRINTIYGTKGVFADYPPRLSFGEEWLDDAKFKEYHEKYQHPLWKKVGEQAKASGGHGGMDFVAGHPPRLFSEIALPPRGRHPRLDPGGRAG